MDHYEIISATLGLCHPWEITSVLFSSDGKRMDINVGFERYSSFVCPACRMDRAPCDVTTETWHHGRFLNYSAYLHARVPYVECPCCGISAVERPWSREGSRFILIPKDSHGIGN